MGSLLDQLKEDLPSWAHKQRVYYSADLIEAARIAQRVRELNLVSVRFVMKLQLFEEQPAPDHPKRAAYDLLIETLREVADQLAQMPPLDVKRTIETSED